MYQLHRLCRLPVGAAVRFYAGLLACASAFRSPSQAILLSGYERNYTLTAAGPRRSFTCFPLSCLSGISAAQSRVSRIAGLTRQAEHQTVLFSFIYKIIER